MNENYQRTPGGLLIPTGKLQIGGWYHGQIVRKGEVIDEWESPNIVVNEGLDAIINVFFRGTTGPGAWFLGLFQGTYTPVATVTAATIASAANELTDYSEATRPQWQADAPVNRVVSNATTRAQYTFTAARTVRGAFLVNASTKSATTGILASAAAFGTARSVVADDQLLLTYNISLTSA